MNFKDIRQAYFLGIGGIGMSAIARYFHTMGIAVSGYDKTATALTRELEAEGIAVHYEDQGAGIAKLGLDRSACLVVLTPAVPRDHGEWNWLKENGFTIMKRSQVLGVITDAYKTIAVAGTHGKTTTSTLIAHILKQSHLDCAAFLGGISSNYESNLLLHRSQHDANSRQPTASQCMVVEADEFDRSFLTLHPSVAIITSTDADHLDIYGAHDALKQSFMDFALQTREGGTLIVKKELELFHDLHANENIHTRSYSIRQEADVYADNIRVSRDRYLFDLHVNGNTLRDLHLGIPGMHNVENATAAAAASMEAGVTDEELREGLASFRGVKRRFEYIIRNEDIVYIDDYAHHPEELRAIISSVKQMYAGEQVTVIFQPHLYSRTRDFADGFAESLSLADEVFMLDIYPARELPIPGVSSEMILEKVTAAKKGMCRKDEAVHLMQRKRPKVLLTLGAGDIDQIVEPLKQAFTHG